MFLPLTIVILVVGTVGTRLPTINVLSKNKQNIKISLLKIFIFYNLKNLYIALTFP